MPLPVFLWLYDEPAHTRRTPRSAGAVLELQRHQVPLGSAKRPRPLPAEPAEPAAGLHNLRKWRDRPGRTVRLWIFRELRENGRMLRPDHLPPPTGSRMLDGTVLPKVQGKCAGYAISLIISLLFI